MATVVGVGLQLAGRGKEDLKARRPVDRFGIEEISVVFYGRLLQWWISENILQMVHDGATADDLLLAFLEWTQQQVAVQVPLSPPDPDWSAQ